MPYLGALSVHSNVTIDDAMLEGLQMTCGTFRELYYFAFYEMTKFPSFVERF